MRIAVNATILDEKPTGLGIYTLNIIKSLIRVKDKDDEITIFTSCPRLFKEMDARIKKVTRFVQPRYGKWGGVVRFLWSQCVFPFSLLRRSFNVLYTTSHYAVWATNVQQILTIHDLAPMKFPDRHRLQSFYFQYILPLAIKRCVKIITVSKSSKDDIVQYFRVSPYNVSVVNNAYDSNVFKTGSARPTSLPDDVNTYLLVIGAAYPHKNLARLVEAVAKLSPEISHQLVIVGGREEYKKVLRQKMHTLNLNHKIKFIDYAPFEELPRLYAHAAAFIFPSLYEGFGIPLVEAMACGCPVISSNVSSLPEIGGDAVYYIDPYSVDSIAKGITRLVNDEPLRQELIQKGLERVKVFSWEKSAREIYQILKEV